MEHNQVVVGRSCSSERSLMTDGNGVDGLERGVDEWQQMKSR